MRHSRPKTLKLAVLLTLMATPSFVAGCTTENRGSATPSSQAPSSESRKSSEPPKDVFADLKACDLLEPITSAQGFDPVEVETYQSDNGCGTSKPRYGSVSAYLVPNAGINDLKLDGGTKSPTTIDGRDAVEIKGNAGKGSCMIGIAVTATARATVSISMSFTENDAACAAVRPMAEQIAPKLPRVN
ncbi:DUF3558 family protein [Amycolatopsis sp. NPDC102389]|uniref:DUF3558 family protein n=1 Tax=Amycolatopsis sp. NPDC102389 TaxID=3363941 RepID=UPI00380F6F18